MTNAPDPIPPAVREIRQLIESRRRELATIDAEMRRAQRDLTSLVSHREVTQTAIDDLARVLESLAPTPETREALRPPFDISEVSDATPSGVADELAPDYGYCPTCGATSGEPCYTDEGAPMFERHADRG